MEHPSSGPSDHLSPQGEKGLDRRGRRLHKACRATKPAICISPTTPPHMPKITYIEHDGTAHTVDATVGDTVMETRALRAIACPASSRSAAAACSCATCLVHVAEEWVERAWVRRNAEEEDQLDFAFDVRPNSRLSCQVKVTEELDGLVVPAPGLWAVDGRLGQAEREEPTGGVHSAEPALGLRLRLTQPTPDPRGFRDDKSGWDLQVARLDALDAGALHALPRRGQGALGVDAAGVLDHVGGEAQLACVHRRPCHAEIGGEPGDEDGLDLAAREVAVEPGLDLAIGLDEGRVAVDQGLWPLRMTSCAWGMSMSLWMAAPSVPCTQWSGHRICLP